LVFLKEWGALRTFTILDRTMPPYICFVYPWYVGALGYLAYKLFKRGVTMRDLFLLWASDFLVDVLLESPGILAGTYLYYGRQPFNIWGFPLWWGFVNPVMPMLAGALIFHIRPHLNTPWKLPAVIACIPIADGVANGATAWPMWAALNRADVSYVWTHLASFVTLGLALFSVWIVGVSVVGRGELAHPESETLWQKLKAITASSSRSAGRSGDRRFPFYELQWSPITRSTGNLRRCRPRAAGLSQPEVGVFSPEEIETLKGVAARIGGVGTALQFGTGRYEIGEGKSPLEVAAQAAGGWAGGGAGVEGGGVLGAAVAGSPGAFVGALIVGTAGAFGGDWLGEHGYQWLTK
jgi:hypothetical protein